MPELSKAVIPPHMGDKRPSEKILKLGRKMAQSQILWDLGFRS